MADAKLYSPRAMQIDLLQEEIELCEKINFKIRVDRSHEGWVTRRELVFELFSRLIARKAIPQCRLNYFTKPEYHRPYCRCSRKEEFEGNGCSGEELIKHPHFLKYLEYFIFGPSLPDALCLRFQDEVIEKGQITSGDIIPLAKYGASLARQYGFSQSYAEEFFKLGLECGLDVADAWAIREKVKRIR